MLCILRKEQGVPDIFELILRQKGCPVIVTCDGQQGLDLAQLEHPDVIIVDELVSGMDGFEVYTALNADDELRQIPLVFIESGRVEHEIWRQPSGDVLRLPVGPQEIFKAIEYVLGNKNASNTARALTKEVKR
jgi:CheY-like chemotaxis protein